MMVKILAYLDIIFPTLFIIVFAIGYIKNKSKLHFCFTDKINISYNVILFLLNIVANTLMEFEISNHWVYYTNTVISHIVLCIYFKQLYNQYFVFKYIPTISAILITVWVTGVLLFSKDIHLYTAYTMAVHSFIMVFYTLTALWQLTNFNQYQALYNTKAFWILTALLTYYGSSFTIFAVHQYLAVILPNQAGNVWLLHNFFLAVACVLFIISLFKKYEQPNSTNHSSFAFFI